MDLKLFLLVGLCCVLRATAQDMRDKAMQAAQSGQLRRLHSRFGRNFAMPPALPEELKDEDQAKEMNEILNTIFREEGELEPGMADKWHLPLEKQLLKYLWSRKSRNA